MKYLILFVLLSCTSTSALPVKTLFVADYLVECTGVAKQQCMLIKENTDDEWTYFYDQIEGFDFVEGYSYELLVEVHQIDNPPADASSQKLVLKELISKSVSSDSDLMGKWKVIKIIGIESLQIFPTLEFVEEDNKVAGYAGCNNYFATYELKGKELHIGAAGATRKMCQDMSVEDVFLKQLDQIAYYKLVKSELHLFDMKDTLIMLAIAE